MDIVIVGGGNVGSALGAGWRKAGHKVTLAVRDPADGKYQRLKDAGCLFVPVEDAAKAGSIVVLAVPWNAMRHVIDAVGALDGKVVIDATNPLTATLDLAIGHTDSAGETVARLAPHTRVVKAFNTTGAGNMADSRYSGGKLMMPVAGNDAEAKRTAMTLAADLGFDAVDVGPLVMSRHLEPMAMVWIKLAIGAPAPAQKLGPDFGFALLRR
jgi:predicted dinucleotide-binding enzyme